ncbi:MAG: hypothetical protein HUU02_09905 [Bacteroidetes bacterium]|nr:hypothetical protein [Bacteroidota bacterium]
MRITIVLWLCILPFHSLLAQNTTAEFQERFALSPHGDTVSVRLSRPFVIPSSVHVADDSGRTLPFTFHSRTNRVVLFRRDLSDPVSALSIRYSAVVFSVRPLYALRSLEYGKPQRGGRADSTIVTRPGGMFSDMFGPELSKSGSISRGFLVGSTRDLTLSSGFRLQMAGKLSDDIDILAALTDENTPIQPQGNTQTLQEIDNVFVEIKHPTYMATLGDFPYAVQSGEFVRVNRKLQGAKLSAEYSSSTPSATVQVTGAASRGKFYSKAFNGLEGVQGPYRLTGRNNERSIIVIAGSERVYVDGDLMKRGEQLDYIIDYASSEVTFTVHRLITGASRIVVDYEYADRQYTRNFAGVDASAALTNDIQVRANYFREGDDPDAPIDLVLNEQEKTILRNAGNAPATAPGIVMVGRDSLGIALGNYAAVDTVINAASFRFFRWDQGGADAVYRITFSPVGQGNGDYRREGIGRYTFVGIGSGDHAPVVLLPSPELHEVFAVQSTVRPFRSVELEGEYAASSMDRNRFSSIGDGTNAGNAYHLKLRYHPEAISVAGMDLGSLDLSFSQRMKQQRFTAMDRMDDVEFGRKWSTDSLSVGGASDELLREARLLYDPAEGVTVSAGYGSLDRTGDFGSTRWDGGLDIRKKEGLTLQYRAEQIEGEERTRGLHSQWFRQQAAAEHPVDIVVPSLRFEQERREVRQRATDSILSASFGFRSLAPKVTVKEWNGLDLASEVEWREDDGAYRGSVIPFSRSLTQIYSVSLREVRDFTASSAVTFRDRSYAAEFQAQNQAQQTTLINLQSRYRPFSQGVDIDLLYDAATQRTATLERYFYKVRRGEGQYSWTDANGNGTVDLNDEREFVADRYDGEYVALTLNSEELRPIVNLKSSARIRFTPHRFLRSPTGIAERMLASVSSETFVRLEERSSTTEVNRIYLLDRSVFLHPLTTLMGYQFFQQDIHLFEFEPEYSFRFRYNQRNGLSRFASGLEENYSRERSLRVRLLLTGDITNQTDLVFRDDDAATASQINRTRSINASVLTSDLSYRPERNIELGLKIETGEAEDASAVRPVTARTNGQTLRIVYGFQGNGQVRAECIREEILLGPAPVGYSAPYELTSGRDLGKNYLWSLSSEYRMAGNVQFSLYYSGRTTPRDIVVHTGRMEVRAFF